MKNLNQQTANSIYLNTLANGLPLDSTSAATLMLIAQQSPLQAGLGVYTAREVLDWDMDDYLNDSTGTHHAPERAPVATTSTNPVFKLYPNPNNGNMTFEYNLQQGDVGQLIIYNVMGQLISTYGLQAGADNKLQISESALKNGVYFYKVLINNSVVKSDKIVIIK